MLGYQAPISDMSFILYELLDAEAVWNQSDLLSGQIDRETVRKILQECGRFVSSELYPLNRKGDESGAVFRDGEVTTPEGFPKVYRMWSEQGWMGLTGVPEYGGQGMPKILGMCVGEMLFAANSAFALYPELAGGAAKLISEYASDELKACYLPGIYSGKWSATMCLTESHCGSDLGMLTTRAELDHDNTFRLSGEKIFISGGEHDLSENIVHLVLARLPNAPDGVKGISLFLVPKYLVDSDGHCHTRNHVICAGVEKKMGIRAASTCVMHFDGAKGYLIGRENEGLAAMFAMMNHERLSISMQGVGLGDASYQTAVAYARSRIQGKDSDGVQVPIIHHGDVRRMLLTMKALNEGGRAFAGYVALWSDRLHYADGKNDSHIRRLASERLSLLTPVVKAFITDMGLEVCLLGQQVLGGHGYIREWGQEQHVRDARIAQIYEGTNGIQALDLMYRKVLADQGKGLKNFLDEIKAFLLSCSHSRLSDNKRELGDAISVLEKVTDAFVAKGSGQTVHLSGCAVEYLHLLGYVAYGYLWLKMADVSIQALERKTKNETDDFYHAKMVTADFYFSRILPRINTLEKVLLCEKDVVERMNADLF